ncbi:hypothetical protein, partial [Treponema sp. R80B11-R83G3]
ITVVIGAVSFSATSPVYAYSYTQNAGSADFNSIAVTTFNGVNGSSYAFEFTGTTIAINRPITTTYASGSGGQVHINAGTMTLTNTITASGSFTQTGTGSVSIQGGVTTTNANAAINFSGTITLTGAVSLNTST